MGKKSAKIISQKAPKKKEPLSGGAKLGISLCIVVLLGLGFAIAERFGITGTQFLFRGETMIENTSEKTGTASRNIAKPDQEQTPDSSGTREASAEKPQDKTSPQKKSKSDSGKKKAKSKKSSAKKTPPAEPLPLRAFVDISRKPHTWPGFIRLTRSRTISMTDSRTGESMGRMEVPKGTVVKVHKVLPTGTLEVFDRTGQKFQVEASGTNFAAAFAAVKNKPKKKSKPKKAVEKAPEKPEPEPIVAADTPKKEKSGSAPVMSAFGVAFDDEEWEDDSDEE